MSVSFVQWGDSGTISTASGAAATCLSANTTVGDLVILSIQPTTGSATVSSVTSPIGTFTKLGSVVDALPEDLEMWACIATGAGKTVTVTTTSGSYYAHLLETTKAILPASATTASGTGTSGTSSLSPSSTSLLVAFFGGAVAITGYPGGSWTHYNAGGFSAAASLSVAYLITVGSQTATFTMGSSVAWGTVGAIFPQSGSGLLALL